MVTVQTRKEYARKRRSPGLTIGATRHAATHKRGTNEGIHTYCRFYVGPPLTREGLRKIVQVARPVLCSYATPKGAARAP